jgi:phage shock protein A
MEGFEASVTEIEEVGDKQEELDEIIATLKKEIAEMKARMSVLEQPLPSIDIGRGLKRTRSSSDEK